MKKQKITTIIIAVLTLVITFTGGFFTNYLFQNDKIRALNEILFVIEQKAKDPYGNELDFSKDYVAKGFVDGLLVKDDYAHYYSNSEYEKIINEGEGKFSGIGVSLYADLPYVFSVNGNSPAEKSGIKRGDLIVSAKKQGQERYTEFSSTDELMNFFKALNKGDTIEINALRGEEPKNFTLTIAEYVASYVEYYDNNSSLRFVANDNTAPKKQLFEEEKNVNLNDQTAIIVFKHFEGNASEQLSVALEHFYSQNKSKLILDLRGNGGGYMDCLIEVASHFIYNNGNKNNLVTKVEGNKEVWNYKTKGNYFNQKLKDLVVLADEGTASASECLIGAMLCYGDANFSMDRLLISYNEGRGNYSTYGKGIMQSTYRLVSGGALKLTTGRVFWPDEETCIHGKGIVQEDINNQVSEQNAIKRAIEILG